MKTNKKTTTKKTTTNHTKQPKQPKPIKLPKPITKTKIKRILIPIDFSPHSHTALAYAQPIAANFNARIDLLYADETNYSEIAAFGPIDIDLLRTQNHTETTQRLKQLAQQLQKNGFKTTTTTKPGRAHHIITQTAQKLQTDLIIITTHGHSGIQHLLMGSTAENVVRHAPCPVLTIRPPQKK